MNNLEKSQNSAFINKLLIVEEKIKENINDFFSLIDRIVYLEKIERKYIKLQETHFKLQERNSKLQERNKKLEKQKPEEFSKILRDFNDLKSKYDTQAKRIKKLESIIKDIPGYTIEDKMEYMEFAVEGVIPWIKEKSGMKSLKTLKSYFYNNLVNRGVGDNNNNNNIVELSEFMEMVINHNRESLEKKELMMLLTLFMIERDGMRVVNNFSELRKEVFDEEGKMVRGEESIKEVHNYYIGDRKSPEVFISPGNELWRYSTYLKELI